MAATAPDGSSCTGCCAGHIAVAATPSQPQQLLLNAGAYARQRRVVAGASCAAAGGQGGSRQQPYMTVVAVYCLGQDVQRSAHRLSTRVCGLWTKLFGVVAGMQHSGL